MFDCNENFTKLIEENKNLIFSKLSVKTYKLGNDHSCTNIQSTKLAKFTFPPQMPKQVLNQMFTSLSRNTTLMQVTRNLQVLQVPQSIRKKLQNASRQFKIYANSCKTNTVLAKLILAKLAQHIFKTCGH
jgi:hypothetical protein